MTYETIRFETRDQIGILTLSRPERLNSVSAQMLRELKDCFGRLREKAELRVIIMRGEGRAFCAGADVGEMDAGIPGPEEMGPVQAFYIVQSRVCELVMAMRQAPQMIIGAVRGPAAGGGFSLALACDVRIAGESARFIGLFSKVGMSGGDGGSTYFLPRVIGLSRATEYLATGRPIDAATADRIGLVSRVVPDDELDAAAISLAEEMLQMAPFGLRLTKELLHVNAGAATLESAIHLENRSQTMCSQTEDALEGPRAFLEKRKPVWRNR